MVGIMPSWNIHTAHVERLFAEQAPKELGIADANAFLFGNYVPDIYLGFMVPDVSFHIDYCLTHLAEVNVIPVPDADRFWDAYVFRRRPSDPSGVSLVLGAWAHLLADQIYNSRFREFCATHDVPKGEERRTGKQADFALFGHSLQVTSRVRQTSELLEAARRFRAYSILPVDVTRSIDVADSVLRENAEPPVCDEYQLLSAEWMTDTFGACDARLRSWLETWQRLEQSERCVSSAEIHADLDCLE